MVTRIAIDAMGGDHAPDVVVEGAVHAAQREPELLELLLFGPQERLEKALDTCEAADASSASLRLVDAPEVIGMSEAPAAAVKRKQRSSIHRGLQALKAGEADAFVSAGNTGAVMAASFFILGRLPGVERPSVIGYIPTPTRLSVLLDVGTNVDCKPEHLAQFARMGTVYVREVLRRAEPSVALLNIGTEPGKGNEQTKAAYDLLTRMPDLNFRGNVEGSDLLMHAADVVVCDGFVGNILLKMGEAMGTKVLTHLVGQEMEQQRLTPDEQTLVGRVLGGLQKPFDYEERGGAPLLGVSGNVMIGHGSSSARAVERLLFSAAEMAQQDVAAAIAAAFD